MMYTLQLTRVARLRRYAAPLYIDLKKTVVTHLPNGETEEEEEEYPKIFIGEASHPTSAVWSLASRTLLA